MTAAIYIGAALAEIVGCFAFWAWWRLGSSALWLVPGSMALIAFGWLLALVDSDAAGRTFAAYGGVYIAASLTWLLLAEGVRPTPYDIGGAMLSIAGAAVILAGSKAG